MKCPNCGYEPPEPPKPPYEYMGYMKPYLPQILKLLRIGQSPGEAAMTLRQLHRTHFSVAMIGYIRKRYGITSRAAVADTHQRNLEIARRYSSEKISMRKLGKEYGISGDRIRCIIFNVERKAMELEQQLQACQTADNLRDVPLEALELPTRVLNCFKNEQCQTVGDAMKLSDADLLRVPNFGLTSLNHWKHHLGLLQREFEQRGQTAEAHSHDRPGG